MNEETQEQQPVELPAEVAQATPGGILSAAREQQGIPVIDVARQLKMGAKQVEALEADDYDNLPAATFLRGFIRNYAKLLQIDPQPALEAYQQMKPQQGSPAIAIPSPQAKFSGRPPKRWQIYAAAAAAALILLPWLVYEMLSGGEQPAASHEVIEISNLPLPPQQAATQPVPPPAPAAPKPAATQPAAPAVAGSAPAAPKLAPQAVPGAGRIKLSFSGESWVEITDKSGMKIFSQLNSAGTEQLVQGMPPLLLTVGNAASVKVTYNGRPVDLAPYTRQEVARVTLE